MITIQHRRADEETWLEHDPVIPDGELALVSSDCGYDIRVGDGERTFSSLPPLIGKHAVDWDSDYPKVTLHHRDHLCYPAVYTVSVELDYQDQPDFTAMLTFTTMELPPEASFSPASIKFSGSDVEDGIFYPMEFKKYTLIFWRDTELNCHVRGVYA